MKAWGNSLPRRGIAVYLLAALLSALSGAGIVVAPRLTIPLAITACLLIVIFLSDSPAIDHLIFFALLSGPPRLRARDPLASLQGQVDWVVILHLLVWLGGSIWVLREAYRQWLAPNGSAPLRWPHGAGLLLAVLLGLSALVSPGPLLTSFRAAQTLVMVLFSLFWVERYGVQRTLQALFWGYVLLGVSLAAAAVFSPQLVLAGRRVRGDLIANTGAVAATGLIMLLTCAPVMRRELSALILVLFSVLLVFSMTRSAYAAMLLFLLVALLRRPRISAVRRFVFFVLILLLVFSLFRIMPLVVGWIIRDQASLASLSARIPWWKYLTLIMWQRSPYIGLGFYAAPRTFGLSYDISIGTAHNAFIEVLVGGGIPSGALFLLIVIGTFARSFKLFLSTGKSPEIFAMFMLLLSVLSVGLVSEEMIIASPAALAFWLLVSLIQKQRIQE
jgi:O-antigen ligase